MRESDVFLRPIPCALDHPRARPLAGGPLGFAEVGLMRADAPEEVVPAEAAAVLVPGGAERLARIEAPRPPLMGLTLDRPRLMGVVNVTPDSFSDGGHLPSAERAVAHALALAEAGADILDIGGESTRPGAAAVEAGEEADRVIPVIEGLVAAGCPVPISIDTRKAAIARMARAAGARMFNDVSALTHDPESLSAATEFPALCLMHAQGDPETMQRAPSYGALLPEIYAALEARIAAAEEAGIARSRIAVDPGIGFGKTLTHNLAILRGLSVFHGLGCALLLGASRKRFIGTITGVATAADRVAGSVAAALSGLERGAQILRVHDVAETHQAAAMWHAVASLETSDVSHRHPGQEAPGPRARTTA